MKYNLIISSELPKKELTKTFMKFTCIHKVVHVSDYMLERKSMSEIMLFASKRTFVVVTKNKIAKSIIDNYEAKVLLLEDASSPIDKISRLISYNIEEIEIFLHSGEKILSIYPNYIYST